jgi:glycerol dehydrogenase-like iron-containing ADH family enzyme
MLKTCVVCGTPTEWRCSDCAIAAGGAVSLAVCESPRCRDAHERSHGLEALAQEARLLAPLETVKGRQN